MTRECKCDMRTRLVGDGCRACNPELAEELGCRDEFGKEAHDEGSPHHSGTDGHYCHDWDGLWICVDCCEYIYCRCEPTKTEEKP